MPTSSASGPQIPFSGAELLRAKELGHQLVLYVDEMVDATGKRVPLTLRQMRKKFNATLDGSAIWADSVWTGFESEQFFHNQRPRPGWRLVSIDVVPGTQDKAFLEQTDAIVNYLRDEVFRGIAMPRDYQVAVDEYAKKRGEIEHLLEVDRGRAARAISDLKVTQLTRETPVEGNVSCHSCSD
ncbi:MAG TPA: hypothetical protein VH684_24400 [Xanthobacteraceae bacterium]|jgi:hypothetical protein